jgi:CRISPR-associated protein Cas1
MSNSIPIVYTDGMEAYAITHPFHAHGTVVVRRQQYLSIDDKRGVQIAVGIQQGAIENKRNLLLRYESYLGETNKEKKVELKEIGEKLKELSQQVKELRTYKNIDELRLPLLGLEGIATRFYFEGLRKLIPSAWQFEKRIKRPPTDPINALISYLSTILTGQILLRIFVTGLDPYLGFIHADRSGRPSLALDILEQFRQPMIDRVILRMIRRSEINNEQNFEQSNYGIQLTKEGKGKVIQSFLENQDKTQEFKQKNQPKKAIIVDQIQQIIHVLLRKKDHYQAYVEPIR